MSDVDGTAQTGFDWRSATDEQILSLRLCDLPIKIEGTTLELRIKRLYDELDGRQIRFKPYVWLSAEWFTPDGIPGFAIPFYLAHPRLIRLERKFMLEVEGVSHLECMRIMRHETGHALSNAYTLHGKRDWREVFGSFTQPYPDFYKPDPSSRGYVLHLNAWYAQAHPAEDFAETFAVWLASGEGWRNAYGGWPALRKLEYVDDTMSNVRGEMPANRVRRRVEPLSRLKLTLREHYQRKRDHYAMEWPPIYDNHLFRIFSQDSHNKLLGSAAGFLQRHRRQLRQEVAAGTGLHHYTVDQALKHMINRCKELKLRVAIAESEAKLRATIMLTAQSLNAVHSGFPRVAL